MVKELMRKKHFREGDWLSVLGDVRQLVIRVEPGRQKTSWREWGDSVEVVVKKRGQIGCVLERWYRKRADEYFNKRIAYYAGLLEVRAKKVVVSGARAQWGSCIRESARVSLQWRLAQAPLGVVDYVIVHELAHLKERGHNNRFWGIVEQYCPEYRQWRQWLKERGRELYRWT